MANTFDADLVIDTLAASAITILQARLAPLNAFTTAFSPNALIPRSTVRVPMSTVASTVATNPTNFETQTATLSEAIVEVNQYSAQFGLTAVEINQGFTLDKLAKIHLHALANKIMDITLAPVTVANYGTASVVESAANFDSSDLRTLWGDLENGSMRNIVLDGAYYAKFLPTTLESFDPTKTRVGLYGFDGFYHNSRWDGAGTNVVGFAASPEALAVVAGLPHASLTPEGEVITENVVIPDLGITVQISTHFSRTTRSWHSSYDLMFGAAKADTTALKIVTSS
jgi:hypothetical protein